MKLFVQPFSSAQLNNEIFSASGISPDDQPVWQLMVSYFGDLKIEVATVDHYDGETDACLLALSHDVATARLLSKLRDRVFLQFEAPVIHPHRFIRARRFSKYYNHIYYSYRALNLPFYRPFSLLPGTSELRNYGHFLWPQSRDDVVMSAYLRPRDRLVVMVNANKRPYYPVGNLYGARIELATSFKPEEIDVYGSGWGERPPFPKWSAKKAMLARSKGRAVSKYATLSAYKFAICFENMIAPGYLTEKLFETMFAGTVPVYLGAPDVLDYVPRDCFIDVRDHPSWDALARHVREMPDSRIEQYRIAILDFLASEKFRRFSARRFLANLHEIIMHGRPLDWTAPRRE